MVLIRFPTLARLLFISLLGAIGGSHLSAAVIYVEFDAEEGGAGTSWADALYSVQDALLYAQTGDEIWVSSGTYYPDYGDAVFEGDRFASFELKSEVSLYGGFDGTETQREQRDPSVNETILSGGIGAATDGSEDSIHVVSGGDTDATAILVGVTISNGSADSGTGEYSVGGALYIVGGSPTITNVTFKDNEATTGGAVHVEGSSSTPIFTGCSFTGNSAFYDGGAVNSLNASPQFSNCTFSGNFALDGVGGALQVSGTGTFLATDCTFSNNESVYGGGGAEIISASPKFTRCTFSANTTSAGAGGGVEGEQGTPEFDTCTFSGNTSNYAGGGLANWSGNPVFTDTSFSSNQDSGDYGGGGVFNYQGSPGFTGCSFDTNYADYGGGLYNLDGAPTILNCNFSSNTEGANTGLGGGAGIFNYDGAPVITGCTFSFNISAFGAGIYNYFDAVGTVNPVIVKCTFTDNSSSATEGGGSGIVNWNAQPGIYNCTFLRNTAQVGAAIWNEVDGVGGLLVNCLFANNTATDSGGAIYNPPVSVNCTFYGNTAATGAAIYDEAGKTLTNCILYGNTATTQGNPIDASSLTVNHSIVEGGYAGQSNLDADPRFTDAANTDFTLANDSPAIDVGDTTSLPADSADLDSDTDIAESVPLDLGDKVRTFREIVDMGAHEFDGNRPPAITFGGGGENTVISLDEGQESVATITAQDPDGEDTLTFSLSGGSDAALFTITGSGGELAFKTLPDFENAGDTDSNNIYEVNLTVTDNGAGNLSDAQAVQITVNDINEPPDITSNGGGTAASVNIAENTTTVTTVQGTDPDGNTLTYGLSGGSDQSKFSISASTGALSFAAAPDYESATDADGNNSYLVEVMATDTGGLTVKQTLTVMVTDSNEAPDITSSGGGATASVNIAENTTTVTTVQGTDPDGNTLTYGLSGGSDQSKFSISASTGTLSFAAAPDYESATDADGNNSYLVEVMATDTGGLMVKQTLTVMVMDSNEAPDITSNGGGATASVNIAENTTTVTTVQGTDPDGNTLTYGLSGGSDQSKFSVSALTGALSFAAAPDYESATDADGNNSYLVEVMATDTGGLTVKQTLTVMVMDSNEAPDITSNGGGATASVNIAENTTTVTTVQGTDPDGNTLTYGLSGGSDQSKFSISASTGALSFAAAPDYESATDADGNNSYLVEVMATDTGGLTVKQTLTVMVTDIAENQFPSFTSHGGQTQVALSLPGDTSVVTTVIAVDPDGNGLAYSLSGGSDQALFNVDVATGQLSFKQAPDFSNPTDADGDNIYEVTIKVTDDAPHSLSVEQSFSITFTEPVTGDGDSDGLPDSWETEHGLDLASDDSGADPDGDNLTNLHEYKLGTDPKDGNSGFRANELKSTGGGDFSLTWKSIPGKSYTVQSSVDLKTWSNLSGPHAAAENETSANISAAATLTRGFYRVVLAE